MQLKITERGWNTLIRAISKQFPLVDFVEVEYLNVNPFALENLAQSTLPWRVLVPIQATGTNMKMVSFKIVPILIIAN